MEDRGKQNTETVSSSWGRQGWIFVSPVMASIQYYACTNTRINKPRYSILVVMLCYLLWYLSHVLYLLRTNKRQKSSLYHHFQVSVSWSMKKYPGAWWGTRSGHRYYILLFNIPDISSASSSLPVSSLRVNEEGNCSESVLESREPGGEQFQDTGIIFLFSTYRVFLLAGPTLKITSTEKS